MAKKSKPVKPASPKGGKALVKKAAPKKAVAKKAAAKKPVAKKPVVKKPVAKKAAPEKAAPAKKAIKKTVPVKPVAKTLPKPAVKKKATKAKSLPVMESLPPVTELSEELVEKAAHTGSKAMAAPANGSNEVPGKTEDPIQAFDKNVFNKATSKGDPHSKLHLSSKPKNSIKPSGKKPLW